MHNRGDAHREVTGFLLADRPFATTPPETTTHARTTPPTTSRTSLTRTASIGAVAGVVASLMMAAYAMIAAATYQGSGFFTRLYHIASVFIYLQPT